MKITLIGDFKAGREVMKDQRRMLMNRIRNLERKHDRAIENGKPGLPRLELRELDRLNDLIPFRSVSTMQPATFKGIVINAKLLQKFMRKIGSRYNCSLKVADQKLTLEYRNRFDRNNKGVLELVDISHHFKGFTDIPKIEFSEEVYIESS